MNMKVTIWQQFSSNHSASFTIAGKFESIEAAKEAEATLRQIIQRVGDDYRQRYTPDTFPYDDEFTLSDVEARIKEEYNLENWEHRLDWTFYDTADETVHRYENLVFAGNYSSETWAAHMPFDELLEQFGADVAVSVEGWKSDYLRMRCNAPDEQSAITLMEAMNGTAAYNVLPRRNTLTFPQTDFDIPAYVRHSGRQLIIDDILIHISAGYLLQDTETMLRALRKYLTDHGCTAFTYETVNVEPPDIPEHIG
jgi:hypothetical protein